MNIVPTTLPYTSMLLRQNLNVLLRTFPFLNLQIVGISVLGRPIYALKLGRGQKKVFYSASYHANEWITSVLLMKFVEDYCDAYMNNGSLYGYRVSNLFNSVSIYIMPMVNPDGVDLVTGAYNENGSIYRSFQSIANNFPSIPFPDGWKANFNGVDLNLQFPARWQEAKKIKFEQGYNKPAPRDFVGFGPLTEPESLAIYNFTLKNNFALTISYHTQGKEIYWNFQDINPPNGYEIGKVFANISGYTLANVPYNSSFAGYKDWFIQNFNRPGYTIEAGIGVNPLSILQFEQIYSDNEGILVYSMSI